QRARGVAEAVLGDDPRLRGAEDDRRFDEGLDLEPQGLRAHHAEVLRDEDHGDRERGSGDAAPRARLPAGDRDRHDQCQQQGRERVDGIGDDDEDAVEPAAEVAGDESEDDTGDDRHHDGHDDDGHSGLGAPDDAGEDSVAADRGAPDMGAAGRQLRTEVAFGGAELVEAVGGDERGEDRADEHDRAQHEPGDEHAALQADRLPQMGDDRQPREPGLLGPVVDGEGRGTGSGGRLGGGIGRLWILWSGHQYLTRGSMKAARTSTMKVVIATMTARNTTIPCTATKSRAVRYSASLKPSPCHPKVVSVSTAPASMRAICMPMTVTIGISAGR